MKFSNILLVICLICCMTSCKTNEKFSVYGPQATKIYTPANPYTPVTISAPLGKVDMSVPSDMYCGYILAEAPGSNVKIPVGLDYRINRHAGTKAAFFTGSIIAGIGGIGLIGGTGVLISDSDDPVGGQLLAGGFGLAAIGAGLGLVSEMRMDQTAYDYNFGYVKTQKLAIPTLSAKLLNPNPPKGYEKEEKEKKDSARKKATSGKDVVPDTERGSKVNKSRSDIAKSVEGTYAGTGSLMAGKKIEEKYADITVILERIDKTHVSVRIIESDEDYFDAPLVYEVRKGKNGAYTLSIDKLPEATMQISGNGKLAFTHKKVNIDNEIYTLDIQGKKTK